MRTRDLAFVVPVLLALGWPACAQTPGRYGIGRTATDAEIAGWNIDIGRNGENLPRGSGTVAHGREVFAEQCSACHGEKGAGKPNDVLVGGSGSLAAGQAPVKTVGSYWPYATTLFDYIRRAMPYNEPKSLTADETYALSAYILALNGIVGASDVLDAQSLSKVKMPNRDGFIPFPRQPR